jgi:ubiquinone/menaquinone biosynthesis C-methylase UbiE
MGLYERHCLPALIDVAMRHRDLAAYRARVVPAAAGRVLEIGIGSGLNLPSYGPQVRELIGIDPSPKLLARAGRRAADVAVPVELIEGSAESLPLPDASVDTVVVTWALCSIPNIRRALREMRRVMAPGGALLFVEHGRAPDPGVAVWQDRLTPVWKRLAGGCHLNRPIGFLIREAGFTMAELHTGYMNALKPFSYMFEGCAHPG